MNLELISFTPSTSKRVGTQEADRQEIPSDGVGSVLLHESDGVYGVASGFAHLLAALIQDQVVYQAAFEAGGAFDHGGDGEHGVKPAAGLVYAFGDEIGGEELGIKAFAVFKGPMPLGKGHAAAIKPAVYHFRVRCILPPHSGQSITTSSM